MASPSNESSSLVPCHKASSHDRENKLEKLVRLNDLKFDVYYLELTLEPLADALAEFEHRYNRGLGNRCVVLDRINAQIAELYAKAYPLNEVHQKRYRQAKFDADSSTRTAEQYEKEASSDFDDVCAAAGNRNSSQASMATLKEVYHKVAKAIHPDLAKNEADRQVRERLMSAANTAYAQKNLEKLNEIWRHWEAKHQTRLDVNISAEEMDKAIEALEAQLQALQQQLEGLQQSDTYKLMQREKVLKKEGRDLLAETIKILDRKIVAQSVHLEALRRELALQQ